MYAKLKNKHSNAIKFAIYYSVAVVGIVLVYSVVKHTDIFRTAQIKQLPLSQGQAVQTTETKTFKSSQAFNQYGGVKDIYDGANTAWFGSDSTGYLGLNFPNVTLPTGAVLTKATLKVTSAQNQWNGQTTIISADKSTAPTIFSATSLPSSKTLTTAKITYTDNVNWTSGTQYTFPDLAAVIKEVVSPGASKNLNLILQGNGSKFGRKFVQGTASVNGPSLDLSYTTSALVPLPPAGTPAPPPTAAPPAGTPVPPPVTSVPGESMAMMAWRVGGKNAPNPKYDKCDDGTDIVKAHNAYYVIAYDGLKYPTWHPPVVTNPITGSGKCYFGHEHGTNPQTYAFWDEVVQHFGKDQNGDGKIAALVISSTGQITAGERGGLPFGIANEHMDEYYNQENRDSIFVRHEDHVGHKIEVANSEADTIGNSTHSMNQIAGTTGLNVPYYTSGSNTYKQTGVVCAHLHKFHQGTHSSDAVRNNLHEAIFHSKCESVNANNINAPAYYPNNSVILTGMMAFGKPGEYIRFCFNDRTTKVCPDGKNTNGTCIINDPLISKLPSGINSNSLGRNMVDKYCFDNFQKLNPGLTYFNPYEIWEGDLRIQKANGQMLAEHGRQWDVLDPVRYVNTDTSPVTFLYNQDRCNAGLPFSGNCARGTKGATWDSPQAAFKGLIRTAYFGRNRISNAGGAQIWWTDPLGGNATTTQFTSGLKQRISPVEADIQKIQSRIQQLYGSNNFLNDRAIQRQFNNGGGTVHAPN